MELTLYSRKWCSWCIDAKDYLKDKGYRFQEIDVGKDRQAYEDMKRLSAQTYVPTFVAGDKVLANFDPDRDAFLDPLPILNAATDIAPVHLHFQWNIAKAFCP